MHSPQPTSIYRNLLSEAWSLAWNRKSLWVFGLFAACISTGGVFEVLLRGFQRVEHGRATIVHVLQGSIAGYDAMGTYLRELMLVDPTRLTVTITLIALGVIAISIAAILSQAALIVGLSSEKELSFSKALEKSRGHFWSILAVDLLAKCALFLLFTLTTLPLVYVSLGGGTFFDAALFLAIFLFFFPAVIFVSVTAIISVLSVVRDGTHALQAIENAVRHTATHAIPAIEFGILIALCTIAGSLLLFTILILLGIPFAFFLLLTLLAQAPFLFAIVNMMGTIVFFTVFCSALGAAVTFQYAAWIRFHDRGLLGNDQPLRSKLARLWAK